MLAAYPYKINNTPLPFPDSWEETPERISNSFETESGHRQKVIVRSGRMSIAASFTVSDRWLKTFETWRDASTLTVSIYDAKTGAYKDYTMEIEDASFSYSLVRYSQFATNTVGLWKLSFNLEEF